MFSFLSWNSSAILRPTWVFLIFLWEFSASSSSKVELPSAGNKAKQLIKTLSLTMVKRRVAQLAVKNKCRLTILTVIKSSNLSTTILPFN